MIYTSGLLIFFGLLLGSIKVCKNGYNQSYFSKDMTDAWKGIAALLIVFHHISQYVEIPRMFSIMRYIGFIMVAVFFFISGYGLVYGLNHKTSYLKNFLKRRLLSIFLPYWIVNVVVIVFLTFLNRRPTISDCIFSLLGFENITGLWFVTAIVIFYIFFWFAFMKFEGRNRYITLGLCLVLYIMVCCILKVHSAYSASVAAFFGGIIWNLIEDRFLEIVRKYYLKCCIVSFFLF